MSLPRTLPTILSKLPTDTVILSSLRTPITRSYKGPLHQAYPEQLLATVLRATLATGIPPSAVQDVAVGTVLSPLGGSKAARSALLYSGYPAHTTSLYTVNRACASSLAAISAVAAQIRTGEIDGGIAAGMESMSRFYGTRAIPWEMWPALTAPAAEGEAEGLKDARDCVMPMGLTSENVAARYEVSRADQDAFALRSHQRAAAAQAEGLFDGEIVPVTTTLVRKGGDGTESEEEVTATTDDGVRATISLDKLAKLKPAFKDDGTSTAGNSSQISDGAAATVLMRRSRAEELGLGDKIMGKFVAAATAGCKPDEMGIGPALAVPMLLKRLGLETRDVDRWEINEAFASQAVYCLRELGLEQAWEDGKVNPDGGAIALGHPLGATGARMAATLMHGLGRQGGEVGVVSMCVGTGMGMAGLFVRE